MTIKEIAAIAGVSAGTVDRALHNRGRVKPEIAMRIQEIARQHGYEPSRAGKALALTRKPVKIGIVVHLTKTGFMKLVMQGIEKAKAELESMGASVLVREIPSLDVEAQLEALDDLVNSGVGGIAVSPADDLAVRGKIEEITSGKGIPVVTFNTDVAAVGRMCFVGQDNLQSGRAAAGLMGAITGGRGELAIITGHLSNRGSNQRVEGFMEEIQASCPDIRFTGIQMCADENDIAHQLTVQCVERFPGLAGIFVSAGGQAGVCEGLEQLGVGDRIKVVVYDLIPETIRGLKSGTIDFVIDQNAYEQGYRPAMILFDKLFDGKEARAEFLYTDIIIKTRFNLS